MNRLPTIWQNSMNNLFNRMNNLFERDFPKLFRDDEGFWRPSELFNFGPNVDVEETDNEVLVRAEMPGMEKDQFHVELERERLIIRGEKRQECEHNEGNYHRKECSYGSFTRTVALPVPVKEDEISAEYKNGVLSIRLPKSEEAKRKRINVNIS
ncbi:MAG: Hsp20/alpha crystallin family protein [bacterium]